MFIIKWIVFGLRIMERGSFFVIMDVFLFFFVIFILYFCLEYVLVILNVMFRFLCFFVINNKYDLFKFLILDFVLKLLVLNIVFSMFDFVCILNYF